MRYTYDIKKGKGRKAWGYILTDLKSDMVDICWGFCSYKTCESEAKTMVKHYTRHDEKSKKGVNV